MHSRATGTQTDVGPWVVVWLWLVAAMIVVTVIVGGATRLTDSGLSITEWQPILGVIPPLDEAAWREAFAKYQTIPEYELVNKSISLSEFKTIYWWEWTHRAVARVIGVAFLLPFLGFWISGRLPRGLAAQLAVILLLGALQGGLGWYMVKSGLTDRVDVSPYRLAAHLGLAAVLLASIIWIALGCASPRRYLRDNGALRAMLFVVLVLLQLVIGGFMAGMDAGLVAMSWPDMNGKLVPDGLLEMSPWWRNLFENAVTVHFNHRLVAYLIVVFIAVHVYLLHRGGASPSAVRSGVLLAGIVAAQFLVGVATVIAAVPMKLALLHQAGALLLLAAAVFHLHRLTADPLGHFAHGGFR